MMRAPNDRTPIKLPEEEREFLVLYTTELDDTFILEPVTAMDLQETKTAFAGQSERAIEIDFNTGDEKGVANDRVRKIRRLNHRISENLKLLYDYRCQICGRIVGREYGTNLVETHHILYFSRTFNNDPENQMVLCPEHHALIHELNPGYEPKSQSFIYPNGFSEKLMFNKHIPA